MIQIIFLISVLLTAMIPSLNKYFNQRIPVKYHVLLAYVSLILGIISLFL